MKVLARWAPFYGRCGGGRETGWCRTRALRCWPAWPTGSGSRARSGSRAGCERASRHCPGRALRDVAVMLADGGDALCDVRVLRDEPSLFGPVASDATAWRAIAAVDAERLEAAPARAEARARSGSRRAGPRGRARHRRHARDRALRQGRCGGDVQGRVRASPRWPARGTREAMSALLRPGNAGSNNAWDHIEVLCLALEQLPAGIDPQSVLVRCDSGGATHLLTDTASELEMRFSVGFDLTEPVRTAILALPETAWQAALAADGEPREGAGVAELADLDLSAWPLGTRAICRRERPHPGAQLSLPITTGTASRSSSPIRAARDRAAGADPPRARQGRGRDPLRQGDRAAQLAFPRRVLGRVRVLIFIDQDIPVSGIERRERFRILAEPTGPCASAGRRSRQHSKPTAGPGSADRRGARRFPAVRQGAPDSVQESTGHASPNRSRQATRSGEKSRGSSYADPSYARLIACLSRDVSRWRNFRSGPPADRIIADKPRTKAVERADPDGLSRNECLTRARISSAALLVNVSARICRDETPCHNRWAIRRVMTRVFPCPAPREPAAGRRGCSTAWRWAGVSASELVTPQNVKILVNGQESRAWSTSHSIRMCGHPKCTGQRQTSRDSTRADHRCCHPDASVVPEYFT